MESVFAEDILEKFPELRTLNTKSAKKVLDELVPVLTQDSYNFIKRNFDAISKLHGSGIAAGATFAAFSDAFALAVLDACRGVPVKYVDVLLDKQIRDFAGCINLNREKAKER